MKDIPEKPLLNLSGDIMDTRQTTHVSHPSNAKQRQEGEPTLSDDKKPRENAPVKKGKSASVFVYLAILFASAFAMLLLAYFVQQRNNETAMNHLYSIGGLPEENRKPEVALLLGSPHDPTAQS